ncbi:hypothetical protein Taro_018168 [Colocasia esculenta]|uniref:DUF4218 domain-containing protein n=1 Tax=Colocasia esculenta TaxID=4460 RepID=A0A843UI38_COLES|nr:hypothetical protein [Colocasia esculenta]
MKVRNKAKVKGSIAEAYIMEEISNFCSMHFEPEIQTRRTRPPHNDDGGDFVQSDRISIFKYLGHLADDVELSEISDESVETLSLSKENEVEEVDLEQPKMELGDSDEEEYISDQNESDNEDVNVEFDISPTSEDEMKNLKIWFEDDVELLQVEGERVVGGDLLPFPHLHHRHEDPRPLHRYHRQQDPRPLHCYHRQLTHNLCTFTTGSRSASPSHMASGSTPPPSEPVYADEETSHHEGEGSYNETMRAMWINEGGIIDSQSIQMGYVLDLHGQPLQEQISNILCTMFEEMQK